MLIWRKSPAQTGKYRWLMMYTSCFEIFWSLFDLPAEIIAHSVGCAFIVFRINHPDAILTPDYSSWVVLIYTAIFGASMALFASHFIYRYGSIDKSFGKRFTSGWKLGIILLFPVVYSLWWAAVVRICFWPNDDMKEYTRWHVLITDTHSNRQGNYRDLIMKTAGQEVENISYIGTMFYQQKTGNDDETLNPIAWVGVCQMFFMVGSSMTCVFGFGTLCYTRLSTTLSIVSSVANNLQKQLFYSLVLQTLIPLVLMHIPITVYFVCPMLNMDLDFASVFVASTITLYPAVDPLPSFFVIKSYREAIFGVFQKIQVMPPRNTSVGMTTSAVRFDSKIVVYII
ncbi:hypothetical protein GCK72_016972 [Caenorhabditis remanei]|uniref:Uncharacterized protein n=1 Tax=Caenorhabditis remanei TaxID=31234 RepID=A0A6A5G6U8_CAERE|nr:hypothetical protein GCK72_016972 [Caenorhabditis remanei]KAF1750422.1 hypothetical protein GCK72_016972 [Caenorhabditis remanei]